MIAGLAAEKRRRGYFKYMYIIWGFVKCTLIIFGVIGGTYYRRHLEVVPISGRLRFIDMDPPQEESLSKKAYAEIMMQYGDAILPVDHPYTQLVRKVTERIIKVIETDAPSWEVYVVDSPQRNAFVLLGGKIFVFTGISPILGNEDCLAAVLGHEIAHQVARHAAEQLSYLKVLIFFELVLSLFMDPEPIFFN
ncbi:hypothetical protein HK102_008846, partial [Quaeritorhiza haematococci]